MERRRGEDESDLAFGDQGAEGESEGVELSEELAVGHVAAGGGVDEDGCGGGGCRGLEEREGVLGEGEWLGERRERDRRSDIAEGFGARAEAALRIDPTAGIVCLCHHG